MERSEVFDKVVEAIVEVFDVDAESVTEEMSFESLDADSFDMLSLLTALETAFETTVDDDSIKGIDTVGAAIDAILEAI